MNLKEKIEKSTNFEKPKITMKKIKKDVKGITLIALVVTFIVPYDKVRNAVISRVSSAKVIKKDIKIYLFLFFLEKN